MVSPTILAVARVDSQVSTSSQYIRVDMTSTNSIVSPVVFHEPPSVLHPSVPPRRPSPASVRLGAVFVEASPHVPTARPPPLEPQAERASARKPAAATPAVSL